jgi:hypothetical protein
MKANDELVIPQGVEFRGGRFVAVNTEDAEDQEILDNVDEERVWPTGMKLDIKSGRIVSNEEEPEDTEHTAYQDNGEGPLFPIGIGPRPCEDC